MLWHFLLCKMNPVKHTITYSDKILLFFCLLKNVLMHFDSKPEKLFCVKLFVHLICASLWHRVTHYTVNSFSDTLYRPTIYFNVLCFFLVQLHDNHITHGEKQIQSQISWVKHLYLFQVATVMWLIYHGFIYVATAVSNMYILDRKTLFCQLNF